MADNVTGEVDQLLADREKYETWLQRLESERSKVSDKAFARVREDYQKRLDEVDRELQAHSKSILGRLQDIEQTVAELEEDKAVKVESLEEARLRYSVGEYQDEDEWKKMEARLSGAVQEVEKQLGSSRQEIARLRGILDEVQAAEAGASRAAAAEPAPATERAEKSQDGAASEGAEDSALEAVLPDEEFAAAPPPQPRQAPADSAGGEAASAEGKPGGKKKKEELGDELAFLESLSLEDSEDELDSLMFLEERGRGQTQTVICPKCSAANDPAEWYCTECGEELPAE
jgi:hypothetical protein